MDTQTLPNNPDILKKVILDLHQHIIALENRIAHMPAPHGQALALTFFQVAPTDDGPLGITGKDSPARFFLVGDVNGAK